MDQSNEMTAKKHSWFWPVQISCWLLISLLNWLAQASHDRFSHLQLYINLSGIFFGGLLVSSLYRYYLKQRKEKLPSNALKLIGFLIISALIQAGLWLLIMVLILLIFKTDSNIGLTLFLYNLVPLTGIMFAWNLVYIGYALMRRYHQTEVEKWKIEAKVKEAQLGSLRAQINPHFLFNALNNIRALILEDPQQARQMLTRFAEIFRHAMHHGDGREVTIGEELHILKQYLELVKIQYEERLSYSIDVDESCMNRVIPSMVLQLLVENAVKHGISMETAGGFIAISIKALAENGYTLTVKNTGSLHPRPQLEGSSGIGLTNITERLRLLYGNRASLHIEAQPPDVIVQIIINV